VIDRFKLFFFPSLSLMHIFVFVNLGFFQRFFAQNLVVQNEKKKKLFMLQIICTENSIFSRKFQKKKERFLFLLWLTKLKLATI